MNNTQRLESLAAFVIGEAKRRGATDADVSIVIEEEVNIGVRIGQVEELQGAGDRRLSLRVFVGQQVANATTKDFRRRPLAQVVKMAVDNAKASSADPTASLPDSRFLALPAQIPTNLDLFCSELGSLKPESKIEMALAAEAACRSDSRIFSAESGFSNSSYTYVYATSRGFCQGYAGTNCSVSAQATAKVGDEMKVGWWWNSGRKLEKVGDPTAIGKIAAERAVRQLGARKVASQAVPVVFDPLMASRLIGQLAGAAHGAAIFRKSSFLVDKLGAQIAASKVTLVDDPFIAGGHGSRPFGQEGLAQSKRTFVNGGKLETYFLDAYAARKLGVEPNGGGISNLYMQPGESSPEDIIKSVKNGLYLQSVSGPGYNAVTGDYSMGAAGMWIENGELAYPVAEITVAGNMLSMFGAIEAIGSDLEFRSSVCAPTLLIGQMTVAGK